MQRLSRPHAPPAASPRIALLALVLATMLASVACGDPGERFPAPSTVGLGGGSAAQPSPQPPCADGDTRDCTVVLGVQGSVVSCYHGVQECIDGEWGSCVDPTVQVLSDLDAE